MSRLSCMISEISDILLENRHYSIAINLLKLADYFKEEEDSPRGKPSRILSRFFLQPNQVPGLPGASSPTAHRSNGHSSYQIGPNLNKSEIPITKIWTLYPQLHHCIRSTFSQYWIIRKLNTDWTLLPILLRLMSIFSVISQNHLWIFNGYRPKIIIMVPIRKCVGLTPIWSNFPDVYYFHTHILNYFLLFYWFSDHLQSHRGIDSDSTKWNQIWPHVIFLHAYVIERSWFW